MSTRPHTESGSWAGKSPEVRRDERRRRLLDAGLHAFGTEGYASSSINRICKQARVTERDLYREFGGKAGLLIAVYDDLIGDVLTAVRTALDGAPLDAEHRIRASLDAFTIGMTSDPRVARVNFLEVVGADPTVEAHRRQVLRAFGALIEEQWRELAEAGDVARPPAPGLSMAVVGAAQELLVDWVSEPAGRSREDVVDALVRVHLAVMRHA